MAKRIPVDERAKAIAHVLGVNWEKLKERSDCYFPAIPIDRRRLRIAAKAALADPTSTKEG